MKDEKRLKGRDGYRGRYRYRGRGPGFLIRFFFDTDTDTDPDPEKNTLVPARPGWGRNE